MADGKKSFLMYCDLIHTVKKMTNEDAGLLLKHILEYTNDQKPEPPNTVVDLVFEPIKQQLKRDLKEYEMKCQKNKENIQKRWNNKNTTVYDRIPPSTKHTDNDNDNDTDNDIKYISRLELRKSASEKLQGKKVPGFRIPKKLLPTHEEEIKKLEKKKILFDDYKGALENYCKEILNRKPSDYATHRFEFLEFLKQSNGVQKFI